MAKAFRDGFTVPLPLSPSFFALFHGDALTASDLPQTGLITVCVRLLEEVRRRSATGGTPHSDATAQQRDGAGAENSSCCGSSAGGPDGKGGDQAHVMCEAGKMPCTEFVPGYTGPSMSVEEYILRCVCVCVCVCV